MSLESLNDLVINRITDNEILDIPKVWAMADWRNGEEQLDWILNAPVDDILTAASPIVID